MGGSSEVSFDILSLIYLSLIIYIFLGTALFIFQDSGKR
jgi:hypothetical protein